MDKLKKFYFLGIGLILLFAGAAKTYTYDTKISGNKNAYQKLVQDKVYEATNICKAEQGKTLSIIQETSPGKFEDFISTSTYPSYVFRNGVLVYWSETANVPEYSLVKNKPSCFLIKNRKSLSLAVVQTTAVDSSTYLVVNLVPLYKHVQDETDYNKSAFNDKIFLDGIENITAKNSFGYFSINGEDNKPVFYAKAHANLKDKNLRSTPSSAILIFLGVFFIGLYFLRQIRSVAYRHQYLLAGFWLIVLFTALWLVILWFGIPLVFIPNHLAPNFINSIVNPTLGGVLLNVFLILTLLTFFSLWHFKALIYWTFKNWTVSAKNALSVALILSSIFTGVGIYHLIDNLFDGHLTDLHYSIEFYLDNLKSISYLLIFGLFGVYFLAIHLLCNTFIKLNPNKRWGILIWLYGTLLSILIYFYFTNNVLIPLASALYFVFVYWFRLTKHFYILRFSTFVYYIVAALSFTVILFYIVIERDIARSLKYKQQFAESYLTERNSRVEFELDNFRDKASKSVSIQRAFERPYLGIQSLRYLVKDSLLQLDPRLYHVEIAAFDSNGHSLDPEYTYSLNDLKKISQEPSNHTDFYNLYFFSKRNGRKYYLSIVDIPASNPTYTLVLKVHMHSDSKRQNAAYNFDKPIDRNPVFKNYSFAFYSPNHSLLLKKGSFDFATEFDTKILDHSQIYNQEIYSLGHQFYAQKGKDGKILVVSQPVSYLKNLISNFSFLFLVSLIAIVFLLLWMAIFTGFKFYKLSFSSKIQFYLNLAFLLPLTVIIIITLGIVRSTFVNIQNRSLLENSINLANTIQLLIQDFEEQRSTRFYLEEQLNNLASSTSLDLNIYSISGKNLYSSVSPKYLSSKTQGYLNPKAFEKVIFQGVPEILLEESIGKLNYKTVYLPISSQAKKLQVVLGISYIDSETLMELQIKEVVATILVIFFIMFIILFLLSYTASTNLTAPLRLIAQRLKKTNFYERNEEIVWKSNDEIGLLTSEYNRMIKKLEKSKEALSVSEKQIAWREMARQVAHEIKNPLTPIKLSIQQLQRTLSAENPEAKDKTIRALSSINEQIDTISDIANSFSEFAKMPVPRSEIFDLVATVRTTVDLYSQNNNIKIDFHSSLESLHIKGDRMILSRAITNVIINGIQSVPVVRRPVIRVVVSSTSDTGVVEIKDNGTGISDDIRKKIFIPNFSTKIGGSGLGLAMSKRGIEHAGGNMWFESTMGEGTTFYIDLPRELV